MAEFPLNPSRLDPDKNFKFRIKWDGEYIAGVDRVSALARTTDVVAHREGGAPSQEHISPGLTRYMPILLTRGRTHDDAFERWASEVWVLRTAARRGATDARASV